MHSNSDIIKFTSYNDADKIVNELFESLRWKHQDNLETSVKRSDFIFDSVQLMYFKWQKVNFKLSNFFLIQVGLKKQNKKNNKSKNWRWEMFLIRSNCCIKLWRN